MSSPLLVSGFSAGYRQRPVVRDLTLPPIEPGGITALVGPNGAGKSTLLRAWAGLIGSSGVLRLGEVDLSAASLAERFNHLSFMPQTLPQRVGLTLLETVINAFKVSASGTLMSRADVHDRSMAVLERIGIAHLALERLDRMSGGQRQLASLAQALVRQPKVLLLDEPTSALDLRYQILVMSLIHDFALEGRIVVVVLHDLNLAVQWAKQVVVLNRGAAFAVGAPAAAVTPQVLSEVYGVDARVETCSRGQVRVYVDAARPLAAVESP
jgi:iron complex transport system ATP-binding protein